MAEATPTRVYLERGRTWTFAAAVDWPGWARRAKARDGDEAALEALTAYADRYRRAVGEQFQPGELTVLGGVPGTPTTDFGAPDARGPWDLEPIDAAERGRLADLLAACWAELDRVGATAPEALRRGPRGGGRDRTQVLDHVREAERAYGRKLGVRVPPRTPWATQRELVLAGVRDPGVEGDWPVRYAVRRFAWHVLDHAWEIEDRSP